MILGGANKEAALKRGGPNTGLSGERDRVLRVRVYVEKQSVRVA